MPIPLVIRIALPRNADLDTVDGCKPLLPLFDQAGIGEKIWSRGGNGFKGCLEKSRQTHQGRVHVELRRQIAFRNQPVDPRAGGEERNEHSRTLNDDCPAALLDQRRVADELQHVAQALLHVEEDAAAAERRTVPCRLAKRPPRSLLPLPTPFVFLPTLSEVAFLQPGQRPVPVSRCRIRFMPQRHLITSQGFIRSPLFLV